MGKPLGWSAEYAATRRRLSGPLVVGVLLLALASSGGGRLEAGEADGESAIIEGLEEIRRIAEDGRFARGRAKLKALLEAHAREPYVLARRGGIEELAERLVFGEQHPEPRIEDALGGRILSYDEARGKVRIRYRAGEDTRGLRREEGGRLLFAPRLAGRFRVKIRGRKLEKIWDNTTHVIFGGDPVPGTDRPQFWVVRFGAPTLGGGGYGGFPAKPATLTHHDGDDSRRVDSKDPPPTRSGRPFQIQIDVRDQDIQVRYDGKRCMEADKPEQVWGFLVFQVSGWGEFALDGRLDPVWVQNELDRIKQKALKAFRAAWSPSDELPAWFFEAPASRPAVTASVADAFPDELAGEQLVLALRVQVAVLAENVPASIRVLEEVAERLPPSTRRYLAAQVLLLTGDYARGLDEIVACVASTPGFATGHLLAGRLLIRLKRLDDALAALERALDASGGDPRAYEAAANALLLAGRPDAAKTIVERARASSVSSKGLSQLERTTIRALRGPMWSRSYEVLSANYRVVSDIDKATCAEAARLLEEALTYYRVRIRWTRREVGKRFTVYLFSGREGFRAYLADLGFDPDRMAPGVAGLYMGSLKQLLIWNLPKREEMLETIRHEGFHQYLDRFIADAPVWLNEGLAVYYEALEHRKGRIEFGQPRSDLLDVLASNALVPLDEFFAWPRQRFYDSAPLSYAQAWLLVHLLLHGKHEHKQLLDRLLAGLETEGGAKVVEDLFPSELVAELDRELKTHMEDLR